MWIDVNTKPKIGAGFRRDRAMIMNCPVDVPDETIMMGDKTTNGILRKSSHDNDGSAEKSIKNKKDVKFDIRDVNNASEIPVKIRESVRTTERLQECVGDAPLVKRSGRREAFQVEPPVATQMWRARSEPLTWGRTSLPIAAK
jgi:hypothetical protein